MINCCTGQAYKRSVMNKNNEHLNSFNLAVHMLSWSFTSSHILVLGNILIIIIKLLV